MARRKKNPSVLGTIIGIAVVGGIGWYAYDMMKKDKAKKAKKNGKVIEVDLNTGVPETVNAKVGNTVRFKVPKAEGFEIAVFTEATAGDPVIVMNEKPDVNGSEVVDIVAHAAGTVRVDFLYQAPPGSPEASQSPATIDLVIT